MASKTSLSSISEPCKLGNGEEAAPVEVVVSGLPPGELVMLTGKQLRQVGGAGRAGCRVILGSDREALVAIEHESRFITVGVDADVAGGQGLGAAARRATAAATCGSSRCRRNWRSGSPDHSSAHRSTRRSRRRRRPCDWAPMSMIRPIPRERSAETRLRRSSSPPSSGLIRVGSTTS